MKRSITVSSGNKVNQCWVCGNAGNGMLHPWFGCSQSMTNRETIRGMQYSDSFEEPHSLKYSVMARNGQNCRIGSSTLIRLALSASDGPGTAVFSKPHNAAVTGRGIALLCGSRSDQKEMEPVNKTRRRGSGGIMMRMMGVIILRESG